MSEENKVRSKTEEFKIYLQEKISEVLGVKVSKQKAWDLFKETEKAPFSFMLNAWDEAGKPAIAYGAKIKELTLPLAGVGTFKIITTGKEDDFSVKGRYYISSAVDNAIKERLGIEATEEAEEVADTDTAEPVASDLDLDL
jgi:hypothetical protein